MRIYGVAACAYPNPLPEMRLWEIDESLAGFSDGYYTYDSVYVLKGVAEYDSAKPQRKKFISWATVRRFLTERAVSDNMCNLVCYDASIDKYIGECDTVYDTLDLYEYYFEEPIVITKDFFVRGWHPDYRHVNREDYELYYQNIYLDEDKVLHGGTSTDLPDTCPIFFHLIGSSPLQFPILVPYEADTSGGGTGRAVYAGREVQLTVAPNPATDRAAVDCSEPMRSLVLSDIGGRTLTALQPDARHADLDLSALPQGTYLITVQTAAGTARRKVTVVR
ncbi:MAG: T9SS type A sorting domain-containing protein [Bacteroidales bacterium]|nr:T9SS type A sorting domain-containing protein [Bacteroidales bacterium]